jgi:hypothetical protein
MLRYDFLNANVGLYFVVPNLIFGKLLNASETSHAETL